MTIEDLKKRLKHLVQRIQKMREVQRHYEKYHIGTDRVRKRRLENEVDGLIGKEQARINSKQKEIF